MTKSKTRGRPKTRHDLKDPVMLYVWIDRSQKNKLRKYAKENGLTYNNRPSLAAAVSELIEQEC